MHVFLLVALFVQVHGKFILNYFKPRRKKKLSSGFLTRSDTNPVTKPHKVELLGFNASCQSHITAGLQVLIDGCKESV